MTKQKPPEPITLRDYFAGQALAGLIAGVPIERAAEISYRVADFMLAERLKDAGKTEVGR